ncbi:MAG: NAD(P)/FAD-dependent oxidoreductase [Desulfobacteraceae bacterium]|nr:NAD(P)/FAD-dependent oxidoreductase [Desulfobacteraceae bacterium]
MITQTDVLIIGAGASGLMCALTAGQRGRKVLVIDHGEKPGRKILISGGGKCNFTNEEVRAEHYICHNPHFCRSALSRFTSQDFLAMVRRHGIAFSRREHGQLFCERGAGDILNMLLMECRQAGVEFQMGAPVDAVEHPAERQFKVRTGQTEMTAESLVVACGGLAMPSAGASSLGYTLAAQFNLKVWPPAPGLVPFTLQPKDRASLQSLSGIALPVEVLCGGKRFYENLLFTHRGLSGPVILQSSLYWQPGDILTVNWLPHLDLIEELKAQQIHHPRRSVKTALAQYLPKRLVAVLAAPDLCDQPLQSVSQSQFKQLVAQVQQWSIKPGGTEGFRTAEVTLGGVDCAAISSKTMEAVAIPGLFFIGEVLDVTGWLGGYNLQWAWSSGWCAGQYV